MMDRQTKQAQAIQYPIVLLNINSAQQKLTSAQMRYAELHQFRQQVDGLAQPYHVHKRNAFAYRSVFILISLLFLVLTFLTYFQNTNWFCGLFFSNCFIAKLSLSGFCGLLSVSAFSLGVYISAEREAMAHLLKIVKRKIQAIYSHQCASLGWKRFLMFFKGCAETAGARRAYHDTIEKVHEIQEATRHLLRHISSSREIDRPARERLLNQALLEMRDKLEKVIHMFDQQTC